jgi:HK97 family phage major capsid protein
MEKCKSQAEMAWPASLRIRVTNLQGMLNAWTLFVGPVLASLQLVQDSAFDIDGFIADRFGEALGREIAALAVSGTGSGQPLGIIPSLGARGQVTTSGGYYQLGTATSVATLGGSVTELSGNLLSPQTLLNMIKSVDPAYRAMGATFYVNDAQLMGLRTVTDAYGRPLLQDPSKESGSPTLWGYPVKVDNLIPNLAASTTGGPVFGAMKNAMVMRVVRNGTTVMRLTERYADYLAVGYIGYYRMDIRSNDLRAAVTVRSAAT